MKISEIRSVIESLNWNRHDLGGATREEFKREDVKTRLEKHIANVEALVIAPRFADDIADAADAITRARAVIARWEELQDDKSRAFRSMMRDTRAECRKIVAPTLVNYSGRA